MRLPALLGLLLLLAPLAHAHPAGDDHAVTYDPAAALFPTADEVQAAIETARGDPWFTVHEIGRSGEGRAINVLEVTDPASTVPREQRVVTLIETQQHGNEPAGTGAAVPLIHDLVNGGGPRDRLANQVLLILPMSNPDGATANTRGNVDGADVNRDHIGLETPEGRAIRAVLDRWDVHVAIDHHEYSGTGLGAPVPVRVYDWDLTTMVPNHGNVRQPTAEAAARLNDAIWDAAQAAGYSVGEYGWTTVNGVKVQQSAGGPDPGILRNAFGLNNVAGLLGETFISAQPEDVAGAAANPYQSAERRIAIHRTVMDATIAFASANAADLIAAKRDSERLNVEEPMAVYSEPALGTGPVDDPTGAPATSIEAPLAAAYVVQEDLSALFALHGLPLGVPRDGAFVHNVHGEARAGLVAAIVHPDSSRGIADGAATELAAAPAAPQDGVSANETPLGLVALAALAMALVAARRR